MTLKELVYLIKSDVNRKLALEENSNHLLNCCLALCTRGGCSVLLYRIKRYLFLKNNKPLNFLVWLLRFPEFYYCHNEIDPRATIGEGLVLSNCGGVALSFSLIIGKNCTFMGRATPTLGAMEGINSNDRITIGDYCVIGHNVRVINPIQIADGVHIKANSVLMFSVKTPGAVLSGFPAKVIQSFPLETSMQWNPYTTKSLLISS